MKHEVRIDAVEPEGAKVAIGYKGSEIKPTKSLSAKATNLKLEGDGPHEIEARVVADGVDATYSMHLKEAQIERWKGRPIVVEVDGAKLSLSIVAAGSKPIEPADLTPEPAEPVEG